MKYFEDLAQSRISEKLAHGDNYIAMVRYMAGIYDEMDYLMRTLRTMRNLDEATGYSLNEIGKILGAYPRPLMHTVTLVGVMQWDVKQWDTVPWAMGLGRKGSPLNDAYYRRYLKAIAKTKNMRGTVEDWEDVLTLLAGARVKITNKVDIADIYLYGAHSDYDIIIFREMLRKFHNITMSFRLTN